MRVKVIRNNKGFTLIELMITVAIVGILAAVALPAYQDYVARSQVSEGLTLVSGAKPIIVEYYSNHGNYPISSDIGFNGYFGGYVGSTTIGTNGIIVATFSDDAHRQLRGQTVTLTPEVDSNTGNIKWSCNSSVTAKYLPISCINTITKNGTLNKNFKYDMYDNYYYQSGIIYMNGYEVEYYEIDEDGIMHFRHEHPQQINEFKLYPDGSLERITTIVGDEVPFQKIKSYPVKENSNLFFQHDIGTYYHKFIDENGVEKMYLMAIPNVGINLSSPLGYEKVNEYRDLDHQSINGQYTLIDAMHYAKENNDISIYNNAVNKWKEKVDLIKEKNGGKLPNDFPQAYIDFYSDNY